MSDLRLILAEMSYRKGNALLSGSALAAAVAICVALSMLHAAAARETRRVQRDIGFNLRIIPAETDLTNFNLRGYSEATMPLDAVHRLAANESIAYNHLVATLQQEFELEGKPAILMGLGDNLFPPGQEKPSKMSKHIEPGAANVGHLLAERLGVKKGQQITVKGKQFEVARVAPPTGNRQDVTLMVNLADAQQVLGMPDRINEIQAIDCLCLTADQNPQQIIRQEVQRVVPEAQVVMLSDIANARARQRQMIDKYVAIAMPLVITVAACWVAAMAILNVRDRKEEIGLLQALGFGTPRIALLFLAKAMLLGFIAAGAGYALGTWLSTIYGPQIFPVTAKRIAMQPRLLWWSLTVTPLFAAAASLIPAALAATQDPAVVLRRD